MAAPARARDARRTELLDAADRIVRRDGPAATMATIATEAGITKPILYRHFGDKGGLHAALTDRYTTGLLAELQTALVAGRDRRDRVTRTVDAYLRAIEREPQVYRFLLHSDDGTLSHVRSFTRRLAELFAAGITAELGVPAVRAATWAHGIVGMVQAAGDWWLDAGAGTPRSQVVNELTELLFGAYASS